MKKVFWVAVCDDDVSIFGDLSAAINQAFSQNGAEAELACYAAPAMLEKAMEKRHFDLILLDISMPKEDGIHFGDRLSRLPSGVPDIIFVSSQEERVFDAFKIHPFGFVRKSCFLRDISAVIADYVATRQDEGARSFVVNTGMDTVSLPIDAIQYFEGARKHQWVHLNGDAPPVQISLSMKQLEEDFSDRAFLRVHTGYLVNTRYIRKLGSDTVTLTDGTVLPVSRRKSVQIKLQYMEWLKQDGAHIY